MQHVITEVDFYRSRTLIPGFEVGGKTGTAQIWDADKGAWKVNKFNYSFVGYIGRKAGHPDLVVAVRIEEGTPTVVRLGHLEMPVMSFELFRRIAHDSISTPFLVPDDASVPANADGQSVTAAYATLGRVMSGDAPALSAAGPRRRDRRHAPPAQRSPDPRRRRRLAAGGAREAVRRAGGRAHRRASVPRRGRRGSRRGGAARRPAAGRQTPARRRSTPWATSPSSSSPDPLRALHADRGRLAPRGSTRWSSGSPAASPRPRPRRRSRACWSGGWSRSAPRATRTTRSGLPLTVLRLGPEHAAAVLEMGMYVGGEIRELARDRAARDRHRDRGPAGPPVADRVAGRDRGRQGRAGRGAAAGRRRRARDPQRRRRARAPRWPAGRAPGR